ncbi:hypothetical protein [Methanopyrus sp.]
MILALLVLISGATAGTATDHPMSTLPQVQAPTQAPTAHPTAVDDRQDRVTEVATPSPGITERATNGAMAARAAGGPGAGYDSGVTLSAGDRSGEAYRLDPSDQPTSLGQGAGDTTQYLSIAQQMSSDLIDAIKHAMNAALDFLQGQALREPIGPTGFAALVVLPAIKAVVQQRLIQQINRPLVQFHLELLKVIRPNVSLVNLMSVAGAATQETIKEALKELDPVKRLFDMIEDREKHSTNEREENAYKEAESELSGALDSLAKYLAAWIYVLTAAAVPTL